MKVILENLIHMNPIKRDLIHLYQKLRYRKERKYGVFALGYIIQEDYDQF